MRTSKLLTVKHLVLACAFVCVSLLATGCVSQNAIQETSQASLNRQFMSQLNASMDDLSTQVETFQSAVSDSDAVAIKAACSKIEKISSSIEAIEAPDGLKDIQSTYVEGTKTLTSALSNYADLYIKRYSLGASAQAAGEVSQAISDEDYASQLKAIQEAYNQGVEKLKSADEDLVAFSKGEDSSQGSSSSSNRSSSLLGELSS